MLTFCMNSVLLGPLCPLYLVTLMVAILNMGGLDRIRGGGEVGGRGELILKMDSSTGSNLHMICGCTVKMYTLATYICTDRSS